MGNNDLNSDDDSEAEFSDCEEDNIQDDLDQEDKTEKMDVESAEQAKALDMETKLKLDPKVEVQIGSGGTDGKTSICPDTLDSGSNKMTTVINANTVKRGMGADPTK